MGEKEYHDRPTFVRNLVQLKEPLKIEFSETKAEHRILLPKNSILWVDFEVANRWTKEDKAKIIGLNKKEYEKLEEQLKDAGYLDPFSKHEKSNFVKGDNEQARELKNSLGLEGC